jgi:hypothetical protein
MGVVGVRPLEQSRGVKLSSKREQQIAARAASFAANKKGVGGGTLKVRTKKPGTQRMRKNTQLIKNYTVKRQQGSRRLR